MTRMELIQKIQELEHDAKIMLLKNAALISCLTHVARQSGLDEDDLVSMLEAAERGEPLMNIRRRQDNADVDYGQEVRKLPGELEPPK